MSQKNFWSIYLVVNAHMEFRGIVLTLVSPILMLPLGKRYARDIVASETSTRSFLYEVSRAFLVKLRFKQLQCKKITGAMA